MPWVTAKPQSCSDLTWFNKRKEEEKLNPWLRTHLVHEEQTQSRDFQVSKPQKPTHTLLRCMLTEPTLSVWHTLLALQTGSHRPPQHHHHRIIHRSCLWTGRSGWMPASSITFLFLILACSNELQTRMFWSSPCVLEIQPSCCDSWVYWWNRIALIVIKAVAPLDDEKMWCNQRSCGKVRSLKRFLRL